MKTSFVSQKFFAVATAAVAVAVLAMSASVRGMTRPNGSPELPNFDRRSAVAQPDTAQQQGRARLTAQLPAVSVDFDPVIGSPRYIRSREGFLTGAPANGQAAAAALAADKYAPVKTFITENAALFRHDASVLNDAPVKRDAVDSHNGLRTVVWEQRLDEVPVFGGILIGHITSKGELVSISSLMLSDLASAATAGTPNRAVLQSAPPVSAPQAIQAAAANIGHTILPASITPEAGTVGEDRFTVFTGSGRSYARLVWLPTGPDTMRLCWDTIVATPKKDTYRMLVDAETGTVYVRTSLTHHISDATYNIYPSDSPSPFTPSLQTPGNFQPPLVNRTLLTTPALDVTASPEGWIPDGGNTTTGNNVDALPDRDFDQVADAVGRPVGNPTRVFDFPLDLTQDPTNYIQASTVQFFYVANKYHDRLYQLGFTEAFGNFQQNNFGRGGFANDRVIAYVQSGADLGIADNAFFITMPDGINGECYMFIWDFPNPQRDGSLDSEIMMHELTHGTSTRLVAGGSGLFGVQADGMGEGWSDFYAMSLLSEPGDNPNLCYANGGYPTYMFLNGNYYFGVRHFPYSTDMNKNPFTFKDIDPAQISPHAGVPRSPLYPFNPFEANESHHAGEVWCVALWEVRANLIMKYGGTAGNDLALQLVTDGLKLSPAYPNFLQARDAILLADRINNGGANVGEIWRGFAKRGMGISAYSPNGNSTSGVREAFDVPGLLVDRVVVLGGNDNRAVDPNECDDLQIYLANVSGFQVTGVAATLSTTNPAVIVVQPTAPYPVFPNNTTNANITPFRISIAPYFVCGVPINFMLVVKTDQDVVTNYFTLPTGVPTPPTRFDNFALAAIPDADLTGTNSPIVVSNFVGAITRVGVSLHLTHTYDQDVTIELISPDGVTNTLSANHGLNGRNYGVGCPDNLRTVFDDGATNLIGVANPPFIGTFVPDEPLAVFNGKSGTNVNGTWKLRVVDDTRFDAGVLQCWSLFLYTAGCTDGGGECPGSDMGVTMSAVPEPVIIGENITYTINVVNNGPSTAKNVVLTHLLPSGAQFISGSSSQGTVSAAGGVISANLGLMNARQTATVTIIAFPTVAGIATSTATASSEQNDFNTANNSATVNSRVNPPTADLAVGLAPAPNSLVLGQTFTYTVSLTNRGPSTASGVQVTNVLPAGIAYISSVASQGSIAIQGNAVIVTFGSLTNGGRATATITAAAGAEGQLTATAVARGNQFDPVGANNSTAATVAVGPAADLAISIVDNPDPVVLRSNFTYVVSVTNRGPSLATSVTVNQSLPAGATIVETNSSQGSVSIAGGVLTATLGNLASGAYATVSVKLWYPNTSTIGSTATVSATQADPVSENNTASASTSVMPPITTVVAAGATLTVESVQPANGAVDNGEQVTAVLRLRNVGNVSTTNLYATLIATNGITPIGANDPQRYGVLAPSGFPVGKAFTFQASGTNAGQVSAMLTLQDGSTTYPPVAFTFSLPNTRQFTNAEPIIIHQLGAATPYPSTNIVSGVTGTVGRVTVTVRNFGHTYPHDVSALLVGPKGQNVLLLSHASDQGFLSGVNLTFDDLAASQLPDVGSITAGTWKPSAYGAAPTFPPSAPSSPYGNALASFNSVDPNGAWLLYVLDDTDGDGGAVTNGWSLSLTTITPVNQIADLALRGEVSPTVVLAGSNVVYTFSVTNSGPNAASFVAFSNSLPAGMSFVSAASSQGSVAAVGNAVVGNLGSINTGVNATVIVVLNAGAAAAGQVASVASVTSTESDLNLVNNSATVLSTVSLPLADMVISQVVAPSPVLVGENATVTLTVSNAGPGLALNVVITNPIPAGLGFVSASSSVGSVTQAGGVVVAQMGTLDAHVAATVTLVLSSSTTGSFNNSATVTTRSTDSAVANNLSVATINVANPAPAIAKAGALLVVENPPANGTVDNGETVTVSLALKNVGSANTVNLTAHLLGTGGVTPVGNAPKTYGQLLVGGSSAANDFTFTATGANGGVVTATLQLHDGPVDLGTVSFDFNLPVNNSFTNSTAIVVPDHGPANPYPSTIDVSGLTGSVSRVAVSLRSVSHSFPRDLNVLLVSPAGGKVLLMSHAGGAFALTNVDLTLADSAAVSLPSTNRIDAGTYKPTAYGSAPAFASPAPAAPFQANLGSLNGSNPNGTWSLFVLDDSNGDAGVINGGWSLEIVTVTPVNAVTDLAATMTSTPANIFTGALVTNVIAITNAGFADATGVFVTNSFPASMQLFTATVSKGALVNTNTGVLVWFVGDLTAGSGASAKVVLRANAAGSVVVSAQIIGGIVDLNNANNTVESPVSVIDPTPSIISGGFVGTEFRVTITAEPNVAYRIEVSPNLVSWSTLDTVVASPGGTIKYSDTNAPPTSRYYRAVRVLP